MFDDGPETVPVGGGGLHNDLNLEGSPLLGLQAALQLHVHILHTSLPYRLLHCGCSMNGKASFDSCDDHWWTLRLLHLLPW